MIEWTVYFTAILPLLYGACNIRALSPSIKHVYPCSMLLSFVSWWQWSIVLFYVYAEGGELSWRGLCRHRWHWGCRFHNLRCRRWRQGRRRGGSLVSVSVFIVYYMYIDLISRWLALITNKSYCFLFLVSTLNKDFLSYLILSYQIAPIYSNSSTLFCACALAVGTIWQRGQSQNATPVLVYQAIQDCFLPKGSYVYPSSVIFFYEVKFV